MFSSFRPADGKNPNQKFPRWNCPCQLLHSSICHAHHYVNINLKKSISTRKAATVPRKNQSPIVGNRQTNGALLYVSKLPKDRWSSGRSFFYEPIVWSRLSIICSQSIHSHQLSRTGFRYGRPTWLKTFLVHYWELVQEDSQRYQSPYSKGTLFSQTQFFSQKKK